MRKRDFCIAPLEVMAATVHRLANDDARKLGFLNGASVHLVVTSQEAEQIFSRFPRQAKPSLTVLAELSSF